MSHETLYGIAACLCFVFGGVIAIRHGRRSSRRTRIDSIIQKLKGCVELDQSLLYGADCRRQLHLLQTSRDSLIKEVPYAFFNMIVSNAESHASEAIKRHNAKLEEEESQNGASERRCRVEPFKYLD